ncbi:MAG: aldose 1-epimerase family protein [Actinomycetes bacterium]
MATQASQASGKTWRIDHGPYSAVIAEVGATLWALAYDDEPLISGPGPDEWPDEAAGQVLAPWAGRLGDGIYRFEAFVGTAALNEAERNNAIHGLVRWVPWTLEAHALNRVTLACQIRPTPAYPFSLLLNVEYRLGRDGLVVTTFATNTGSVSAPLSLGFHPYLTAGTASIDLAHIRIAAGQKLNLDERLLPTGDRRPVAGTEFDFRSTRALGPSQLDLAYTELERDALGHASAAVINPDTGEGTEIWLDGSFRYLVAYTPIHRRNGLAIEPMTSPPDALRSGKDLIVLDAHQQFEAVFGIRRLRHG